MADPMTPAPAAAPKKKNTGKIIAIVAVVLLVLCAAGVFGAYKLLNKAVDVAYAEGNCIDQLNTGSTAAVAIPQPVECSDSKAKAKILKVYDDKKASDAEALCGNVAGAVSFVEITLTSGSTKLLCLGEN
jgi:hypothetical protein